MAQARGWDHRRLDPRHAHTYLARVLRAGGVFAGTDSLGTGRAFKLLHIGDTLVPVIPDELPVRIERAGLVEPRIDTGGRSSRFHARKPV
jgi:hypothetical protein